MDRLRFQGSGGCYLVSTPFTLPYKRFNRPSIEHESILVPFNLPMLTTNRLYVCNSIEEALEAILIALPYTIGTLSSPCFVAKIIIIFNTRIPNDRTEIVVPLSHLLSAQVVFILFWVRT